MHVSLQGRACAVFAASSFALPAFLPEAPCTKAAHQLRRATPRQRRMHAATTYVCLHCTARGGIEDSSAKGTAAPLRVPLLCLASFAWHPL